MGRKGEQAREHIMATAESIILMSKVLGDQSALPTQILQYRNYVRLVFGDT